MLDFSGSLDKDREILNVLLRAEAEEANFLKTAPAHDAADRNRATGPRERGLWLRESFLRLHMSKLYDELTCGCTEFPRLDELAERAATAVSRLVPTAAELAADRGRGQRHKDGREQELGVFFGAVLDAPAPGRHLLDTMRCPTGRALDLLPELRGAERVDLGPVCVEFRDGAGHVLICHQQFLNAEDDGVVEALETAVDLVLLDDRAAVGVLRGAPMTHPRYQGRRVFSSGINLTHLYEGRISLLGFLLRRELGYISKIYRGLAGPQAVEKPWIAAVDTFAIGGGAQLTLVFDHVVADTDAYYTLPALQEGIIPGAANLRLGRLVGPRVARQLIFADRRIRAADPDGAALADEVVPTRDMDRAIETAAARLTNPAVVANRRMLRLAEEPEDTFRTYMAEYARHQSRRLYSTDLIANLERTWIGRSRT
ncbi:enoyl-CoA hydratase/isomerase family protein [Streptomyces sp. NPDC006285]|uniref:enoyl-CoA hydratase/isomerase family protein n=1 Tax=Streptomyces sp. NPDC006285 TaxID=3364742 RepID=UPI0036AB9EAE